MAEYTPAIPPQVNEDMLPFLNEEFVRVAQAYNNLNAGYWDINYNMPSRIKPGLIKYFDGANANPLGSGKEGIYFYGLDGGWHYCGIDGTGTGYVTSVNGQTGDVTLDAADVGAVASITAGSNISVDNTDPQHPVVSSTYIAPVTSVNGETGVVVLDASDVGADAAGTAASTMAAHVAAADPHTQYALESSLATVATTGSYTDLTNKPIARRFSATKDGTTQSAAGVSFTKVVFQTLTTNVNSGFDLANSRLVVPEAGDWLLIWNGGLVATTAGDAMSLRIFKNGSQLANIGLSYTELVGSGFSISGSYIANLAVNDIIEYYIFNSASTSRQVLANAGACVAMGIKL